MSDETKPGRLKAIFRNAVAWGAGWTALGTAVATIFRLGDKIPFPLALLDGLGMGVRIGFAGAITGAAFAVFISTVYRGKRLAEISALRFGAGGLVLAGLFVPLFLETMSIITGGGLVPFRLVADDMIYSALFGGITAAGSMKLAQLDESKNPVTFGDILERMEQQQSLNAGDVTRIEMEQRARATERG